MAFDQPYGDRDRERLSVPGEDGEGVELSPLSSSNSNSSPPSTSTLRSRLTSSLTTNSTTEKDESHLSLFSQLLPEPSNPRAQRRTLATGIVFLFFTFILWKMSSAEKMGGKQEWTLAGYEVNMGAGQMLSSTTGKAEEEEIVKQMNTTTLSAAFNTTINGTSDSLGVNEGYNKTTVLRKSEEINLLAGLSALSEYTFHSLLVVPPTSRLIVLGDIHGSFLQMTSLLSRLSYDPTSDTLLHVGDLISKSTVNDSLAVVKQMREWNVRGVRGNHDQGVLEWRNWMEAMGPLATARKEREKEKRDKEDDEAFAEEEVEDEEELRELSNESITSNETLSTTSFSRPKSKPIVAAAGSNDTSLASYTWLSTPLEDLESMGIKVPKGWTWGSNWFEIARALPHEDAEYLRELPLTIRIDQINTFIVHAGMLPWATPPTPVASFVAPTYSAEELAFSTTQMDYFPSLPFAVALGSSPAMSLLLFPENTSPFTLLNMRTVSAMKEGKGKKGGKKGGKQKETEEEDVARVHWDVSKKTKGTSWHDIWEAAMAKESGGGINLIYGHWASQRLTIRDHSYGLDSGCAYGRRLSALVLSPSSSSTESSPLSVGVVAPTLARRQGRVLIGDEVAEDGGVDEDAATIEASSSSSPNSTKSDASDLFEEESITLDGNAAWVVSRSCSDRVVV